MLRRNLALLKRVKMSSTMGPSQAAALNARRESARQQMMFTGVFVLVLRKMINFVNFWIYLIQYPFRKWVAASTQDSNVFYIVFGSFMGVAIPYILYPYFQEVLDPDPRQKKEEDRVRQNLQRGEDPLPFFRDKANVRGQPMPVQVTDDSAVKLNIAPEWLSMDRFRQGRADDLAVQRRRHEEWIRLQEEHRKGQFGVFAHMDKWSHIDRYRKPITAAEAWSPLDPKGPKSIIPGAPEQY